MKGANWIILVLERQAQALGDNQPMFYSVEICVVSACTHACVCVGGGYWERKEANEQLWGQANLDLNPSRMANELGKIT